MPSGRYQQGHLVLKAVKVDAVELVKDGGDGCQAGVTLGPEHVATHRQNDSFTVLPQQ